MRAAAAPRQWRLPPPALLLLCACCCPARCRAQDEVVELSPSTFEKQTKNDQHWMLLFYAPWCVHCKRFHPTWNQLGRAVAASDTEEVSIGKLDSTEDGSEEVTDGFDVSGYPTIALLTKAGKKHKYNGNRDLQGLLAFLRKHTGVVVEKEPRPVMGGTGHVIPLTARSMDRVLSAERVDVFVRFTAPWCGECAASDAAFAAVARAAPATLAVAELDTDKYPDAADRLGVRALPAMRLYSRAVAWTLGAAGEGSCHKACEAAGRTCEAANHSVWGAAASAQGAESLFREAGITCAFAPAASGSCTAPLLMPGSPGAPRPCHYPQQPDNSACAQTCRPWGDEAKVAAAQRGASRLCPCRGDSPAAAEFSGARTAAALGAFLRIPDLIADAEAGGAGGGCAPGDNICVDRADGGGADPL